MEQEPVASRPLTLSELGSNPTQALADAFACDLWRHLHVDLLRPT